MSIKQLQQEVSRGLSSPAYLFYSSDDFLLYEVLSTVKSMYHSDAFNFDIFDIKSPDDSKPVEQIIDILNTLPFLSERRVVVIENIQKLSKKDALKVQGYLLNPADTSLMIMLFSGTAPKLFDQSVVKNLKTIGLNVQEKDIPVWIKEKAKRMGVEFSDKAVQYLINIVGADLGMLHAEIEKLSAWNISRIDIDDIKGMVYAGAEYSAFDLVNALKKKDKKEVFRIFETIKKNLEMQMLLGALNYQYASLQSKINCKDERFFQKVFTLLHEADVGIKTSKNFIMEDLLVKLLKIDQ